MFYEKTLRKPSSERKRESIAFNMVIDKMDFNSCCLFQTLKSFFFDKIQLKFKLRFRKQGFIAMSTTDSTTAAKKVVIHLRATGDAPILKQAKFKIAGTDKFAKVTDFLRRQLHRDTMFVYVNGAFSPNPDELVMELYNNFGFDGKLAVNYASSMAWG